MARHETKELTLNEIINRIEDRNPNKWYEIVGIDIPGLDEAYQSAFNNDSDDDLFEICNKIEADYLKKHGNDKYRISWPEHVTFPRFNNDAFYTRISEDDEVCIDCGGDNIEEGICVDCEAKDLV